MLESGCERACADVGSAADPGMGGGEEAELYQAGGSAVNPGALGDYWWVYWWAANLSSIFIC